MIYVSIFLGLVLGGIFFQEEGLLPGAALGYAVYQSIASRRRILGLREEVDALAARLQALQENESASREKDVVRDASETPLAGRELSVHKPEVQGPPVAPSYESAPSVVYGPSDREQEEDTTDSPASPALMPDGMSALKTFLFGGNWLVRIGVAVLFIGLSFLVRFAIENQLFPIELRLISAGITGLAMVVLGGRLVPRRPDYGLTLEGGGLAVLYLTVFASYRLYNLLPEPLTAALLVLITAAGVVISIRQDAQWLSVVSFLGGFFVPVLIASDSGSHVALFGYYCLLNTGLLVIAWFKPWRYLNVTGFLATFGVATAWGGLNYEPALFRSTEPFLVFFFGAYLAIAVVYATRHQSSVRHVVDGALVFGLPVVAFSLQAALVEDLRYGLAWSAAFMGITYLTLAGALRRALSGVRRERLQDLIESFDGIGIAFVSMTLPFSVSQMTTGIGWALEGAALVWLGLRQRRRLVRWFGYALALLASLSFLSAIQSLDWETIESFAPVLNPRCVGYLVFSFAMLFLAFHVKRKQDHIHPLESVLGIAAMLFGVFCWLAAGFTEISRLTDPPLTNPLLVVFCSLTAMAIALGSARLSWIEFARTTLFNAPLLLILLIGSAIWGHPFRGLGGPAWLLAAGLSYASQFVLENNFPRLRPGIVHAMYVWVFTLLLVVEGVWAMEQWREAGTAWPALGFLLPIVLVSALIVLASGTDRWPVGTHRAAYLRTSLIPIWVALIAISFQLCFTNTGNPDPLRYIPLLNPLDLVLAASVVTGYFWFRRLDRYGLSFASPRWRTALRWVVVGVCFVWLNATLARTVHHWAGLSYSASLLESSVFQTTLSICWTALAVATMAFATRRSHRTTWVVAASLLGVVVVKLFVIDLSSLEAIHKIVSFIVVGVLLLLIGYLAPAPPRESEEVEAPESRAPVP